jgi:hypothetical protein
VPSVRAFVVGVVVLACLAAPAGGVRAASGGPDLWVDGTNSGCSDAFDRQQASVATTPWCSVARAGIAAQAGDTVHVRPARYVGTVRLSASGTSASPIRFIAGGPGVVLDGAGAASVVKVVSVSDVALVGMAVTGASAQGIWVDGARRITLDHLTVQANQGHGVQILRSDAVAVSASTIRDNAAAGIFEGSGTTGGRYVDSQIVANGVGAAAYNGDGIQLGGSGAYVAGNTISANGTPGPYEHGIYAGPSSRGYVIESNVLSRNAGSNVKAAGSDGIVRYNRMEAGRLGLVVSDNASPVLAYYNAIFGRYQHAVFVGDGAQAKLWNNTIVVTLPDASGDPSALFVKAAKLLDLRNNLVSYTSSDNRGRAIYVADPGQIASLVSSDNWFSTPDAKGRSFYRAASLDLAGWRKATGQDAKSLSSMPPSLASDARVTSKNLGIDRGQNLGLTRDYAGRPLRGAPDLGAHES